MKQIKLGFLACIAAFVLIVQPAAAESDRTVNVTLDPVPLLLGLPGFGVSFYLGDRFALGVIGSVLVSDAVITAAVDSTSTYNYDVSAYSIGLEGMIGLSGPITSHAWYLSPSVLKSKITVLETTQGFSGIADVTSARLVAGYQWLMGSGFNIRVGGGFSTPLSESFVVKDPNGINSVDESDLESFGSSAALEFKLGWAF